MTTFAPAKRNGAFEKAPLQSLGQTGLARSYIG